MATLSKEVLDRYAKEMQESEGSTSMRIPFLKLATGKTKVRILPGQVPGSLDKDWYVKALVHYNINPNNPKIPVISPKSKDPDAPCPIHDRIRKLRGSSDPADQAEARRMWPKTFYYMSVLLLDGPEAGSVKVLQGRKTLWKKIMSLTMDSEYGNVTDPVDGFDLTLVKTGKDLDTEYDVIPSRNPSPISEDPEEVAAILNNLYDLWRFREAPSKDEIVAFMNGEIGKFTTGGFGKPQEKVEEKVVETSDETEDEDLDSVKPIVPSQSAPTTSRRRFSGTANLDAIRERLNQNK